MTFSARIFFYCASLCLFISLVSCSKDGSAPGANTRPVFDTAESAKPVAVTEKEHRIYIRPKVGDVFRYAIAQHSSTSQTATGVLSKNETAVSDDIFYVKETIRAIRPDTSIDMTFRFDSLHIKMSNGKMNVDLSSNRPADLKDSLFTSYAALLGEDIGVIVTRFGDIKEMYGMSNIMNKVTKGYPDSLKTAQAMEAIKNQVQSSVAQYIVETMMRYPDHALAKDSTQKADFEQNVPVWASVMYPMQIDIKQVLTGFEERSDKTFAVFNTLTTVRPTRSVIENGPVKSTLNNFAATTKEDVHVEDATGVLVYRKVVEEQSYTLILESKAEPGKGLTTERKSKSVRTAELLR